MKSFYIHITQYDKIRKVDNRPENLAIDLYLNGDEDDLPLMPPLQDDEVKKSEELLLKE